MSSSLAVLRPVGNIERYSLSRQNADIYYNVIVGTRLQQHAPRQGRGGGDAGDTQWILNLLTQPLVALVQRHPALSAVIADHLSPNPTFLRMASIDVSKIVRVATKPINQPKDVVKVLEEEHAHPFDLTDHTMPLWRIVVAPVTEDNSFYLLCTFSHVIGDGRAGTALTEELVQRLNNNNMNNANDEATAAAFSSIVIPPSVPMLESLEGRVNCSPSIKTVAKEVFKAILLPSFIKKALETRYWAGEVDATLDEPHETLVDYWRLTKEETAQVVKAAKERKTTVHAILYSASLFATKRVFLSQHQQQQQQQQKKNNNKNESTITTTDDALVFTTPVSLRPLVAPLQKDDFGNYTSEIETQNIQIGFETSFWTMAQHLREQIVQGTQTPEGVQGLLEHIGLLKFVPNHQGGWEEFLCGRVQKQQHGRGATLELSNVGRAWDQKNNDVLFKVVEGIFSQSANVIGSAVMLNAATADNVLTMVATWQKATFHGREKVEAMMLEFKRVLLDATSSAKVHNEFLFQDVFA